jgi:hypothetical protein
LGGEAEGDLEGEKGRVVELEDDRHAECKLAELEGRWPERSNDSHAEDVCSSQILVEVWWMSTKCASFSDMLRLCNV